MTSRTDKKTWKVLLGLVLLVLGGLSIFLYHRFGLISCPIYRIFGIPCPTCGTTRAWVRFFKGDIAGAFSMHPLFLFIPIFILYLFFYDRLSRKSKNLARTLLIGGLSLLIFVWIYRMLVFFPNREPMLWKKNALVFRLKDFFRALIFRLRLYQNP